MTNIEATLTQTQLEHVASTYPECREQLTDFLKAGVDVIVKPQNECGPDVPSISIVVASDPEFWIDCCDTVELAIERAQSLGLRVVQS